MQTKYCTYFDKNYLPRGLALLESLFSHEPTAKITVLCLDSVTRVLLKHLCPDGVAFMTLEELEARYPELLQAKAERSAVEYYWTLTPVLMTHLLEASQENDDLIYLDADQFFFNHPKALSRELQNCSVALQPHNFPKKNEQLLKFGRYNVGVLGAKKNASGLKVIRWWREKCLQWCHDRVDGEDRFGDQKYLDFFAQQAPGVCEFRHPGIGVAPWNHENASFSLDSSGRLFFGKVPLVIFHYHALRLAAPDIIALSYCGHKFSLSVITHCYAPYAAALDRAYARLRAVDPHFNFGFSKIEITPATPLLVRTSQAAELCAGLPNKMHSLPDGFTYVEPQAPSAPHAGKQNLWVGNYASWEEASREAGGYDNESIVSKAVAATRMVRDGKAVCERDTVLLPTREYLWPTLSGLLLGAARNNGELHVVDFGGALGSSYRTHLPFLRHLKKIRWHVVELPTMARAGKREFETDELRFHEDIESCLAQHQVDGILMGGSLQYLPEPYAFLASLCEKSFDYIILDRTSFQHGKGHRLSVQHVPEYIYKACYPCWILDYNKCLTLLMQRHEIIDVLPALEGTLQGIAFRGLIATAKAESP